MLCYKIPKVKADTTDLGNIEVALKEIEYYPISCCNWKAEYPYSPNVHFKICHNSNYLIIQFKVEERYTAALVDCDNGKSWTDSCVEFFIAVDNLGYYNFEITAIGKVLLCHQSSRGVDVEKASSEVLSNIIRYPSLPIKTFTEKVGNNEWSMLLLIPTTALFKHTLRSWDKVKARANLYKCGDNLSHPHFLSWQPIKTPKPDFHRPEFFAPIELE